MSRLRYSSIPRDGSNETDRQHFNRLEPATSSLRSQSTCGRINDHCKTLPNRRSLEKCGLVLDETDTYARLSRGHVRRRPSHPTRPDKYMPQSINHSGVHMATTKSASLPGHTSMGPPVTIVDPLAVPAEDLASQLTLIDLPVFRAIAAEEFLTCAWNKKNKREVAPNIVAFTRRFNHVSFWTVQEILRHEDARSRTETMSHFIKVAKKLHELNNLHSEFAVLSGLQSAPIYRLSKTWVGLNRSTKQTFDKLVDLFSERDNFCRLRDHMNSTALKHSPCIPYLGLYLTDLMFVDIAHPSKGELESQQRQFKMNNILRLVSELQQSCYVNLSAIPAVQSYLSSIRYIEELQKFLEDDHFKLSVRLEPNSPAPSSSSSSKESVRSGRPGNGSQHTGVTNEDFLSEPNRGVNLSPAKRAGRSHKNFIPSHRKSKSEGGNIFFACAGSSSLNSPMGSQSPKMTSMDSLDNEKTTYSLLDGSLLQEPPSPPRIPVPSPIYSPDSDKEILTPDDPTVSDSTLVIQPGSKCNFQGYVQRKTLIKDGRRPLVAAWQRYWLELWGSNLIFYLPKTLTKSRERRDFKSEPSKFNNVEGWLVMLPDQQANQTDKESFQLADPVMKNVYRFRGEIHDQAAWVHHLTHAARGLTLNKPPANLISFE